MDLMTDRENDVERVRQLLQDFNGIFSVSSRFEYAGQIISTVDSAERSFSCCKFCTGGVEVGSHPPKSPLFLSEYRND